MEEASGEQLIGAEAGQFDLNFERKNIKNQLSRRTGTWGSCTELTLQAKVKSSPCTSPVLFGAGGLGCPGRPAVNDAAQARTI